MTDVAPPAEPERTGHEEDDRRLLTYLAVAMVATGQPVHEVDEEMSSAGRALGYPDVQVAAGPTSVTLALAGGAAATVESVSGPLRLDQAAEVRLIRHQLMTGTLDRSMALDRLRSLRGLPERYPRWLSALAWIVASVGICLVLQPGAANVALTAVGSAVVLGLSRLSGRYRALATLLPSVAAFVVGCLVFLTASAGLLEGALRTLLPPLAILLPGAVLVTGLSEIAAGAMVTGVARVGYGTVQLLMFALGIAAAAAMLRIPPAELDNVRVADFGWWALPVGIACLSLGLCLMESVRLSLLPWIVLVLVGAVGSQLLGQLLYGPALGGFLGAVAASFGASVVELARPQLPRLVVFLPAFWMLVPGSLGLLSVTELVVHVGVGGGALVVVQLALAIALGLLVGSVLARSLRRVVEKSIRRRASGSEAPGPHFRPNE